jgi:tetratricopeptide (TPR) repeat protein
MKHFTMIETNNSGSSTIEVTQVTDDVKTASDRGIRRTYEAKESSLKGSPRKLAKYFHNKAQENQETGPHSHSPTLVPVDPQGTLAATITPIETCSHSPSSATTAPNAMMTFDKDPHIHTSALNSDPFQVARLTGQQLHAAGCIEEALLYFGYALQLKRKTLRTEDHSIQAAFSDILFDIGVIQAQQGGNFASDNDDYHYLKSMEAFRICLDVRQSCFGSDHPAVASAMYHLALSYAAMDEPQTAMELLMESLAILQCYTDEEQGVSPQDLRQVWMTLGNVQESLGLHEEAKSSFQEAYEADSNNIPSPGEDQ